jgi:hypothetical protein
MPTPRDSTRRELLSERPRLVRGLAILAWPRMAWCPRKADGVPALGERGPERKPLPSEASEKTRSFRGVVWMKVLFVKALAVHQLELAPGCS